MGNLTVSHWQDNRPIVVIVTNSDPTTTTILQRKKDGSRAEYSCPNSIGDYNDYMGGVDANDQFHGYYKVPSKCKKHYKYIFWFLFDLAITNVYIVWKSNPANQRMNFKLCR